MLSKDVLNDFSTGSMRFLGEFGAGFLFVLWIFFFVCLLVCGGVWVWFFFWLLNKPTDLEILLLSH